MSTTRIRAASAEATAERADADHDVLLTAFSRLATMLERPVGMAEMRAAAPMPEGPVDRRHLARMAHRLGFDVAMVKPSARRLRGLPIPYLVIGRKAGEAWIARAASGDALVLVDPSTGATETMDRGSVAARADGILLIRPEDKDREKAGSWRDDLFERLRPVLAELIVASVVINLIALAAPLFMMVVYNKVVSHGALGTLDVLTVGMITLVLFEMALRAVRSHISAHTGARLDAAMGAEVMHHVVRLPFRVFEQMSAGQMVERLRQLEPIRTFFTSQMPLVLVDLAFSLLFVAAVFALDSRLGLTVLAAIPPFFALSWLAHRSQARLLRGHFRAQAAKAAVMGETVANALTVKYLGLEPEMERRFEKRLAESAWTGFRAGDVSGIAAAIGLGLQQAAALVLIYVGARAIVAGDLTIGALFAASILGARALAPLRQIFGTWRELQTVREAFARLDTLMAEEVEGTEASGHGDVKLSGRLKLEGVSFGYRGDGRPAIEDVTLEVEQGRILGVTGAPGSGKSTLVKLLLGVEAPTGGRVLIDDFDVRRLAPSVYRSQIGVVPQDIQLFAGTIAENITMGAPDRSFARVVAAARFVGLHEAVQRLPEGYDTRLGERGAGLSTGQRQLVAIARALVRNPRILVMDEATSALDTATEEAFLANLRRAAAGRTIVLITHRIAALSLCDEVVVLQHGKIVRSGPSAEIVAHLSGRTARSNLHAVS
ncbi:peptidase domain-containing ABC transporter [Geminicoccus roseus]|uniref:peptidase domain-containing ABC transporter n=1 Tax=Geminicoccus roseus TaxID=404900 RepID=UPI00041C2C30|nr:peptidase domain-containing ABC transporter [Geminicoccus roseus]